MLVDVRALLMMMMTMMIKMAMCHVIILLLPVTSHGHLSPRLLSCPTLTVFQLAAADPHDVCCRPDYNMTGAVTLPGKMYIDSYKILNGLIGLYPYQKYTSFTFTELQNTK